MSVAELLATARSLKDSDVPDCVWVLSEFLKAPREVTFSVPFTDPSNPLVTYSVTFTRAWERVEDMSAPDLDRVYVDAQYNIVIRPDETVPGRGDQTGWLPFMETYQCPYLLGTNDV